MKNQFFFDIENIFPTHRTYEIYFSKDVKEQEDPKPIGHVSIFHDDYILHLFCPQPLRQKSIEAIIDRISELKFELYKSLNAKTSVS